MVALAEDLVLILLDCTEQGSHPEESQKYGVTGLPTIVLTDPDGEVVGELEDRSPQGVKDQLEKLVEKHSRRVPWMETVAKALAKGKKEEAPVLLLFTDDGEDSKALEGLFADKSLREVLEKFVLVKHEVEKRCEVCKLFRAGKGGKAQILDPLAEDPAKKPLSRISGKKKAADLKKALESALKRWAKAREKE